jgi:hypothetical protein
VKWCFLHVKCAQNELYYHSEHVFGVSKTPRTITWGYTCPAPENRPSPRTVMQLQIRRQHDTLVKHTYATPVFHTTSKTHNIPHTIVRISARTHQSRSGSWAGSTGLASNCIRSASGSTLSQHTITNDQRAEAAQSMRHWPAEPPPSRKTCLQYASISPRRAARQRSSSSS